MTNGITEMDGKFYQKAYPKLRSVKDSRVVDIVIAHDNSKDSNLLLSYKSNEIWKKREDVKYTQYHLDFLSDEEIKEGDWKYSKDSGIIEQQKKVLIPYKQKYWKKIIASTDRTLIIAETEIPDELATQMYFDSSFDPKYLPRPSNEFLKTYCEQGGIDEVLIEMIGQFGYYDSDTFIKLKVKPDNTIITKPIKTSWNRKELEAYCKAAFMRMDVTGGLPFNYTDENVDKWIKQNL